MSDELVDAVNAAPTPQAELASFERGQASLYASRPRYGLPIARANLKVLSASSLVGLALLAAMLLQRCLVRGYFDYSLVPFMLALGVMVACYLIARHAQSDEQVVRAGIIGSALYMACWYALVIFYDTAVQPDVRCVMTPIVFAVLPSLFDSRVLNKVSFVLPAYAVFVACELVLVSPELHIADIANTGLALILGLIVGGHKSSTAVGRLVLLDMYQAATKTSVWVSQADFTDGSFRVLRTPSYIPDHAFDGMGVVQAVEASKEFIDPEYRDAFSEFLDSATIARRLEEADGTMSCTIKDVEGTWLRMTAVEQNRYHGRITSVAIIINSVDAEVRRSLEYQEELRATALEAQRANVAKTNFLRRMSHDVRTPINAIRGELLIADANKDDPQVQVDCRRKIGEASDYLLSLVNNILDMGKLESGGFELQHVPFDLVEQIEGADRMASVTASENNIEFEVGRAGGDVAHQKLVGSPKHLRQILTNLATNAVKYNRPGGSVEVSCRELSYDGERAWFEFKCADTGIGMSEEFQRKMYEPFAQEERDENVTAAGSGLGLCIVRELVEQMGGSITCNSEMGKGTTFYVRMPFEIDRAGEKASGHVSADVSLVGKRALLVEDNELNREIACFILEGEALAVDCATNGREGLEVFAGSAVGTYDIVFMDVMMPVMDGLEATRAIRALTRADAASVPIVAMTANAFQDDIQRSREAGMNEHLVKPVEPARIHEALQNLLGGEA